MHPLNRIVLVIVTVSQAISRFRYAVEAEVAPGSHAGGAFVRFLAPGS